MVNTFCLTSFTPLPNTNGMKLVETEKKRMQPSRVTITRSLASLLFAVWPGS